VQGKKSNPKNGTFNITSREVIELFSDCAWTVYPSHAINDHRSYTFHTLNFCNIQLSIITRLYAQHTTPGIETLLRISFCFLVEAIWRPRSANPLVQFW